MALDRMTLMEIAVEMETAGVSFLKALRIVCEIDASAIASVAGYDAETVRLWQDGVWPVPADAAKKLAALLGVTEKLVASTAGPTGIRKLDDDLAETFARWTESADI